MWDFYLVTVNKTWWDKLPADVRAGLKRALDRATEWNWENTNLVNKEAYEKIAKSGATITDLTPEQRKAWATAVQPIWTKIGEPLVGKDAMSRIIEIGDRNRK